MKSSTWIACLLLAVLSAGGCSFLHPDRMAKPLVVESRMDQGLTLVLPGIEGRGFLNRNIRNGIADGGVPTAIRIYDWTLGPVLAVVSEMWEGRARRKADDLCSTIRAYKILHPNRPVVLVGHSGGCAIAIFAAERLPAGVNVDAIIMLAPSIGPDYDLSGALRHVDGKIYSYYSHKDSGFGGGATWVFGTLDGTHASAAGRVGFNTPAAAAALYKDKLEQIPWSPEMSLSGNDGGHTDWANRTFVFTYLSPRVNFELRAHDQRVRDAARVATTRSDSPR
ncbi:MAG: hypothetical protein PHU85_08640, partial [Phycisphaerae bacterium]|nr:hypothetical protein [Phycisphaerae bacterium]